ncbi:SusD/RagB family nutrient-binding outer membrane lipoprotein [Pedobacter sp.]|uniref:SusD/RagB family nutrient-binding outer membrane lipoprotein n=1 Tax=Pedobacter sp. TaxID=1411316 RepID=UPI003D7F6A05
MKNLNMKNSNFTISVITGIMLILTLPACKKYFEVGENPNQIADPPINTLLTTVTSKAAFSTYQVGDITSYFVQYLASPSVGGSTDTYQPTDYSTTWNQIYFTMADLNEMKTRAREQGATEHVGVANLLIAYEMDLIINMWGNGPYTEAFNQEILTPRYDDQETFYNSALTLVNEGLAELSRTDASVGLGSSDDLIYGGDTEKWLRFGNLIKARLLNKVSKKSIYNPSEVLAAVDLSFKSNADNAGMSNFAGNNPWADVAISNTNLVLDGWLSEQLVNALNGTTFGVFDPRIEKITDTTIAGIYKGTPNGAGNVGPASNTVRDESYVSLNSPLSGRTSPVYLATYAELKFIEAEAAFRSGNTARAYTAYREGIVANMNQLGVATAAQQTYLASSVVASDAAALTLNHIFRQKYITTYLMPEAWVDARRFDYQYVDFTLPVNADLPTFIRRVEYVDSEKSKNGNNVPQVTSLAEHLWWDTP